MKHKTATIVSGSVIVAILCIVLATNKGFHFTVCALVGIGNDNVHFYTIDLKMLWSNAYKESYLDTAKLSTLSNKLIVKVYSFKSSINLLIIGLLYTQFIKRNASQYYSSLAVNTHQILHLFSLETL